LLGIIPAPIQSAGLGDRLLIAQDITAVGLFVVVGGADPLQPFPAGTIGRADRLRAGMIVSPIAKRQAGT
jgi:hypothetical protein